METQHPVKILRRRYRGHETLKDLSTQSKFSEFLGCSESLIRAVESGRLKLTDKLRKRIEQATGVAGGWLLKPQLPDQPIPAAQGGVVTDELLRERFRSLVRAEEALVPPRCAKAELARAVGKLVETTLLEMLNRGDTRLIDDIKKLFLKAELIGPNMQHAAEAPLYYDMLDPGSSADPDADFQVPDVKIILRKDLRSGGKKCLSKWPESPNGPGFFSKSDAPASTSPRR